MYYVYVPHDAYEKEGNARILGSWCPEGVPSSPGHHFSAGNRRESSSGCTGSAGLLAVSPPYSGRGQEFLVGDPYQIAPFVLGNIESGIRACNEFVKRTDLHVT